MRQGKRVLAVIPARGGSKGIPRKNVTPVAGRPLISYTTELLKGLPWIDTVVVSTDDLEIADVCKQYGVSKIAWRPDALSGDFVGDMPVLAHALAECEAEAQHGYDVVIMLQPTSPLRRVEHVEECFDTLVGGVWDSVWTVSTTDLSYHPQKQVKIAPDGTLDFFTAGAAGIIARQQLQPSYHRNGVCYAFTANFARESSSVFSPRASAAVVISGRQISIDTQEDIRAVEAILESRAVHPRTDSRK